MSLSAELEQETTTEADFIYSIENKEVVLERLPLHGVIDMAEIDQVLKIITINNIPIHQIPHMAVNNNVEITIHRIHMLLIHHLIPTHHRSHPLTVDNHHLISITITLRQLLQIACGLIPTNSYKINCLRIKKSLHQLLEREVMNPILPIVPNESVHFLQNLSLMKSRKINHEVRV